MPQTETGQVLSLELSGIQKQNESIGRIAESQGRKLLAFIRSRISSERDAEDILQDVLYQFTAAMREDPIDKAASWLFKAAGNRIIDWYRKKKHLSLESLNTKTEDEEDYAVAGLEDLAFDDTETPDILFTRGEFWPVVEEILEDLPDEQRDVFIMNEIEGKTFREISETTGEGVNTLISRKRYAVLELRKRLKDLYDDMLDN
jgi:RNA polymerase sigma factor (sigma-70 family)